MLSITNTGNLTLLVNYALAILLSVAVFPSYINWLKKKQIGQFIREEGPKAHIKKGQTPTAGGLCIISVFITSLLMALIFCQISNFILFFTITIIASLAGVIGLLDDLAKLKNKTNAGLKASSRLIYEAILGICLGVVLFLAGGDHNLYLGGAHLQTASLYVITLPIFVYVFIAMFFMMATTNAVNLHDGMDGLAAGTSTLVFITLAIVFGQTGKLELAIIAASAAGSTAGFLLFNRYPAKIFMGDSGSLFLGALMAALVVASGLESWFILLAFIYIIETLSVIMQVTYFKLTKDYTPEKTMSELSLIWLKLTKRLPGEGKRLLEMAPLHHHCEIIACKRGITEWQVTACFWGAQFICCVIFLSLYFIF